MIFLGGLKNESCFFSSKTGWISLKCCICSSDDKATALNCITVNIPLLLDSENNLAQL